MTVIGSRIMTLGSYLFLWLIMFVVRLISILIEIRGFIYVSDIVYSVGVSFFILVLSSVCAEFVLLLLEV